MKSHVEQAATTYDDYIGTFEIERNDNLRSTDKKYQLVHYKQQRSCGGTRNEASILLDAGL